MTSGFVCQMPTAIPPRARCREQCKSCETWELRKLVARQPHRDYNGSRG